MLDTIRRLKERIEELELLVDSDSERVYLNSPYVMKGGDAHMQRSIGAMASGASIPAHLPEPIPDEIAHLTDAFLARFGGSAYFFFDPLEFRHSVLLPLPFGHQDRPCPALLSVVYLWGSIPSQSHMVPTFLECVLQNIPHDLKNINTGVHPKLILETLQAEVMLSLYLMHVAAPVQGRYHCAAAVSIALSAGLHLASSPQRPQPFPPFPATTAPAADTVSDAYAFWAVVILNSCWIGADGAPSSISYDLPIDAPWDANSQAGGTIQKFLNGDKTEGLTSVALLAKAGALLERSISFASRPGCPPDTLMFASLERRLLDFHASFPSLHGEPNLTLAHAFIDLAILRLHAPYSSASEHSKYQALAASARILAGIESHDAINLGHVNPVFGPIYWTVASFYISEITVVYQNPVAINAPIQINVHELRAGVSRLMGGLASLAPYSPMFERCYVDVRMAYDNLPL
ncbi:hypothetical protein B0H19DRAFT_1264851 [Mycena capillaripes]|nr:hypothetical protein B0H19DRAFT_1264851 [Mycena capillaripes]